ncbi:acyl-CoA reductase LuxC [Natranaerovirga pectinivora]|uniref:Acyl-CoA reductase LuxC n=1 Tax=Natranaerovirga pectinivora TaxID=682400 RepID=A0A4V2UZX2_9FIRM|nr:acyl-CoA reductase [Natranaerovirga pectinivora]TCT12882.1 acyl-CoA reductase LuxC [Natranaerovirga pectinivora]
MNIYRGELISKKGFINKLEEIEGQFKKDLINNPITPEIVIEAAHKLANEINKEEIIDELIELGLPRWSSEAFVNASIKTLNKKELNKKVEVELGEKSFHWTVVNDDTEEKNYPLGILVHIGAANVLGLSAFSVLEGLLTKNINILKLPEQESGLSVKLLLKLIEIEPRLKPFIYVLDVSSKEKEVISKLIKVADAVVVWGSDDAISGIRLLAPPNLPIIEWGHRLSFAYFTNHDNNEEDLEGLAKDICLTDQLYCSSPQCILYEGKDKNQLIQFGKRLSKHIERISSKHPNHNIPIQGQGQITWLQELVKMEEILNQKQLITNEEKSYSIMIDYKAELKSSPLYRNIWLMPVKRENLFEILRAKKGYLQTVGLSCSETEFEELSKIFYSAGVNRITTCGNMSNSYSGEPHDGSYTLNRYVRKVNKKRKK